jgi:hypothetical protein
MTALWELLVRPETGGIALAALAGAAITWIAMTLKLRAEAGKYRAETKKIESDNRRAAREELRSRYEQTTACAANLLDSTSRVVNQLNAVFFPFAFSSPNVSKAKKRELLDGAKRFRQEQLYRPDVEKLTAELSALDEGDQEPTIDCLRLAIDSFLLKVSEKKTYVSRLEAADAAPDLAEEIKAWLNEVLERQVAIGALVGTITGRLATQGAEQSCARPRAA